VENQDTYRLYAQLKAQITDSMKFHADASYGRVTLPQVMGSPAQPVSRGPALTTGAVNQFYVPIANPFAAEFAAEERHRRRLGLHADHLPPVRPRR
jgi:iron complex outermembrane receptor protein